MTWKECGSACPKTCDTLNEPEFCIQVLDLISLQLIFCLRFKVFVNTDFIDLFLDNLKENRLGFL